MRKKKNEVCERMINEDDMRKY